MNTKQMIGILSVLNGLEYNTVLKALHSFHRGHHLTHASRIKKLDYKCTIRDNRAIYEHSKACIADITGELYYRLMQTYRIIVLEERLPVNKKMKVTSTIQSSDGQSIEILIGYTI